MVKNADNVTSKICFFLFARHKKYMYGSSEKDEYKPRFLPEMALSRIVMSLPLQRRINI